MATFPSSYKDTIQQSKLKPEEISKQLNLSKRRWQSIYSGHSKMDSKEFQVVRCFVEDLQRTTHVL